MTRADRRARTAATEARRDARLRSMLGAGRTLPGCRLRDPVALALQRDHAVHPSPSPRDRREERARLALSRRAPCPGDWDSKEDGT